MQELAPLGKAASRHVVAVYGGEGYGPQKSALPRGADVVVATAGRLEDLIEQGSIDLGEVDVVVVDEADRMADMGFLPAVRRILDATSPDRQTMLFSATFDGGPCAAGHTSAARSGLIRGWRPMTARAPAIISGW